jgi:hypothetical protein
MRKQRKQSFVSVASVRAESPACESLGWSEAEAQEGNQKDLLRPVGLGPAEMIAQKEFYPGLRSRCSLQPGLLHLGRSAPESIAGTFHFTKGRGGETVH